METSKRPGLTVSILSLSLLTVMAVAVATLLSMALYGGQFLSPILLSVVRTVTGTSAIYLPYYVGAVTAVLFILASRKVK